MLKGNAVDSTPVPGRVGAAGNASFGEAGSAIEGVSDASCISDCVKMSASSPDWSLIGRSLYVFEPLTASRWSQILGTTFPT